MNRRIESHQTAHTSTKSSSQHASTHGNISQYFTLYGTICEINNPKVFLTYWWTDCGFEWQSF